MVDPIGWTEPLNSERKTLGLYIEVQWRDASAEQSLVTWVAPLHDAIDLRGTEL